MFPINIGVEGRAKAVWTGTAIYSVPVMVTMLLIPDGAKVKRPVFDTEHILEPAVFHKARILACTLCILRQ